MLHYNKEKQWTKQKVVYSKEDVDVHMLDLQTQKELYYVILKESVSINYLKTNTKGKR